MPSPDEARTAVARLAFQVALASCAVFSIVRMSIDPNSVKHVEKCGEKAVNESPFLGSVFP